MTLEEKIFFYKTGIDPELVNLPLEEFLESVALRPSERKEGKELLKELQREQKSNN